jgi:hypothetical protein
MTSSSEWDMQRTFLVAGKTLGAYCQLANNSTQDILNIYTREILLSCNNNYCCYYGQRRRARESERKAGVSEETGQSLPTVICTVSRISNPSL